MNVVVVLLSCFALSVAQKLDLIDDFGLVVKTGMSVVKGMASEFLSEDGAPFREILVQLEPQICPQETKECNPGENWAFGCNCRKDFQELGECKNKPCQLYKHLRDEGPASLNKFIDATSVEETLQSMMDFAVIPVFSALCECSEMIGASANCAKNYDGKAFEVLGLDGNMFYNVVDNLDWESLKTVLGGFVKASCGVKNGKDCVLELSKMDSSLAKIVDSTLNREDVCLSLIRVKKEFTEFLMAIKTMGPIVDLDISSFANRMMGIYVNIERKGMCDPSCAGEMSAAFYTCCTKHALEVVTTKEMKKAYRKLFENLWSIFSEAVSPDLSKAVEKFSKILDAESFCGDQTDVYKVKNEQCEAIQA